MSLNNHHEQRRRVLWSKVFTSRLFLPFVLTSVFLAVASAFCFLSPLSRPVESSTKSQRSPKANFYLPNPMRTANPTDSENEHVLAVPYYNLTGGWKSTLMLSNQGPNQMQAEVTLFGLHGERLDVPALTLQANTANLFDLRDWATSAFTLQEGSLQVRYAGRKRELAGVVKIVRVNRGLVFDEQLTEPEEYFKSSRLEGVWWLPSEKAELSVVVSNTTDAQLSATVALTYSANEQGEASTLSLRPHETRVINAKHLSEERGKRLSEMGGVSLNHTGAPGAVFAEALVQQVSTGYSSIMDLRDPQVAVSSRLDGAGLRIGRVAGERLSEVAVARNIGDTRTKLAGRIVYTTDSGGSGVILIPDEELNPGEVGMVKIAQAIKRSGIREGATAGLEFEYTSAPGSVVVSALSLSESEDQVFRVPLVDAKAQKINTGKYPWTIDASSSTVVYLKNVTDEPQEYTLYMRFPGGSYVPGLKRVEAGKTVVYDLRQLRDEQTPDQDGHKIPRETARVI